MPILLRICVCVCVGVRRTTCICGWYIREFCPNMFLILLFVKPDERKLRKHANYSGKRWRTTRTYKWCTSKRDVWDTKKFNITIPRIGAKHGSKNVNNLSPEIFPLYCMPNYDDGSLWSLLMVLWTIFSSQSNVRKGL